MQSSTTEISVETGKEKVRNGALLLDVRTPAEFAAGHLPGAVNLPHDQVLERVGELGADTLREIVIYCAVSPRAVFAQRVLRAAGFQNVFAAPGYREWLSSKS